MSQRLGFLFLSVCLLLAGCAAKGPKTYLYQAPTDAEGQKCVIACKQSRSLCKNACNPRAKQCQLDAKKEYERYVADREMMGVVPSKTLKQLFQEKQCSPKECGCDADYRSCFQLCGGAVERD